MILFLLLFLFYFFYMEHLAVLSAVQGSEEAGVSKLN